MSMVVFHQVLDRMVALVHLEVENHCSVKPLRMVALEVYANSIIVEICQNRASPNFRDNILLAEAAFYSIEIYHIYCRIESSFSVR